MGQETIQSIPKVLLHTHLEGSIPSEIIHELSLKNNIQLSFNPFNRDIYKSIQAHNWETFRKIYFQICSCFHAEDDFYTALLSYGIKLSGENVIYAELHFSPWKHLSRGIFLDDISKGFIRAIVQLEQQYNITIKLICDLVRNKDEKCEVIIDWLKELPKKYFVALGISGGINAVDRIHYRKYCEVAKSYDLKITAHAGEIEGPSSVTEVIEYFKADRIGHGIRSIESRELLNSLIAKKMHFEICPTANRIIGLCENNFTPIKTLIDQGVNFSINTDDELIFDTNIIQEIEILINEGIVQKNKIKEIQHNTLLNAFADDATKNLLAKKYFLDD